MSRGALEDDKGIHQETVLQAQMPAQEVGRVLWRCRRCPAVVAAQPGAYVSSFTLARAKKAHHGAAHSDVAWKVFLADARRPEMAARISAVIKPLGFRWVALDLDGYRTGSLNEVLPIRTGSDPADGLFSILSEPSSR